MAEIEGLDRVFSRKATDGHRPAAEELWYCPNCGNPATAFVSFRRVIACGRCRWTFDVGLGRHVAAGANIYVAAEAAAEQREVAHAGTGDHGGGGAGEA